MKTNSQASRALFFFLMTRPPPPSTLFPYTTLFRSDQAREGLRQLPCDLRPPRHRDLGDARAPGDQALRQGAREDARLAAHPRADDGRAAAPVGRGLDLLQVERPRPDLVQRVRDLARLDLLAVAAAEAHAQVALVH